MIVCKMLQYILLCVGLFATGSLGNFATYIKPCPITDSACIVKSAEFALPFFVKGIDEYGVRPMDPLATDDINANIDGLSLSLKNMVVRGLGKCKFNKIVRDPAKSTIFIDVECPIECVGSYKLNGKLIVLDVEGEGPFEFKGDKLHLTATIKTKTITKEGKKYYKLTGFDYKYDPLSKFFLKFFNLYNGDKAKAEPVEKLLDENWKEVLLTIGDPVMREIISQIMKNCGKLIQSAPLEEIEIA